jgi:hypothetical protein
MPQPNLHSFSSPVPSTGSGNELQIVLFGLPGAGKSSLLGALGEAARTQEGLLGGRLTDRSGGLTALADRLYAGQDERTAEEVVPYPVRYEPSPADGGSAAGGSADAVDAVVMDCDGRVATDLLQGDRPLDEDSPEGTLAHEVLDADTLLLVVDASAEPARVETDFAEFNRFLGAMQRDRGARAEVGGLPVFLVLTKCDLLARPGEARSAWVEHVEQRKRDVDAHFREFLARTPASASPVPGPTPPGQPPAPAAEAGPFGRIDLRVWATAVKRPALADAPARPREPYGVAELFRLCLADARSFSASCRRSSRRLTLTVVASALLVLGMTAGGGTLLVLRGNSRAAVLEARVEDFRFFDKGTPAQRFNAPLPRLREKLDRLRQMHDDPQFHALPPDLRHFVDERLADLQAYIPYMEKVLAERPPDTERTLGSLGRATDRLKGDLALPRLDWADTPAALLVRQRLEGGEALRRGVQAVRNWYLDNTDAAGKLWTFAAYRSADQVDWPDWAGQVEKVLDPARKPPFHEADPLPGAPGSLLTYGTAMRFDEVLDARAAWDAGRDRLRRLLGVAAALGLAPPAEDRPAVLTFGRGFTLAEAHTRTALLRSTYPDYRSLFVLKNVPDEIRAQVLQAARRQYQALLVPGRAEVLRQLQLAGRGKEETAARWAAVRAWLREPEELSSWRVLAGVLLQLLDPAAEEPTATLAAFLGKKQFVIEIDKLTLQIPEVRGLKPREDARLVVLHPASDRQPALAFSPSGGARLDARAGMLTATYRLSEGQRVVYRPGDKFWAELPLRGGKEKLVWVDARSAQYPFECLRNPPRLVSTDAVKYSEGRLIDGVVLGVSPADGLPRVPDLLPAVRLGE